MDGAIALGMKSGKVKCSIAGTQLRCCDYASHDRLAMKNSAFSQQSAARPSPKCSFPRHPDSPQHRRTLQLTKQQWVYFVHMYRDERKKEKHVNTHTHTHTRLTLQKWHQLRGMYQWQSINTSLHFDKICLLPDPFATHSYGN